MYGDVPLDGVTVAVPLSNPHVVLIALAMAVGGGVVVNVTVAVAVQLLASVIVTLYAFAERLVNEVVVAAFDQVYV